MQDPNTDLEGPSPDQDFDASPQSSQNEVSSIALAAAAAGLPLAAPRASFDKAAVPAPGAGFFKLGGFTIWGVDGDTVTAADFAYDSTAQSLTVNTDKHFAIQNTDQTKIDSGADEGRLANPAPTSLIIPAGASAFIRMENVSIKSAQPIDIKPGAHLAIILGDSTKNEIAATNGLKAALHCPTGSSLTIDDTVLNRTSAGEPITPENGVVPANLTLADGRHVSKGAPLSTLDSDNPGELYAWTVPGSNAAAIGSDYNGVGWSPAYACQGEAGGSMTFEGGKIIATSGSNVDSEWTNGGSGIGGGTDGNGTGPNEWITINGGRVIATGAGHGAGIGAGLYAASGNIRINGGFVQSFGGIHSNGFGGACNPQDSSAFKIVLTGGTLLPTGGNPAFSADAGAPNIEVIVTGGSLGNQNGASNFRFVGTAKNDKDEPIAMIQVDLTSDVGENTYPITEWQLLVDGEPYDYGAPAEFDKGHLYLWLPERVKQDSEVTVKFTYLDTDKLDENGNPTPVTPLPLFRPSDSSLPPDAPNDGKLRRYADFELGADYLAGLSKYYDGEPFPVFPLPLRTPDGRDLTQADKITFKYQRLDGAGNPVGAETDNGADVGTMKFTAISTQYSGDTEGKFSESYWGHRATGRCEIWPIGSQIAIKSATWENGQASEQENPSDRKLSLTCTVRRADADPSGAPTKDTCAAPAGYVQLFVDGQKAGEPIEILFADKTLPDGTVLPANATANGDTTTFTYTASPAEVDHLVPVATPNGHHEISVQYLPPNADDAAPANYLASANPEEDPDAAPKVEVAISPIDPNPTVTGEPDPDCKDPEAPAPEVATNPGQPADPGADPSKPSDKVFRGTIVTTWGEASDDNPHPGRVLLKVKTPSSGPISVTDAKGNVFTADFVRDAAGNPVRDEDGAYALVLDPTAVGRGELTFKQEPNGAYTGSTWVYDVTVRPNSKIAPQTSVSKRAENLTHPNGPTQPGDRIRYTVTASNAAAGSSWNDVVLSDPLPACLQLDEGSVRLASPSAPFEGKLEKTAGAPKIGQYSLSAPGADGRRVLEAPAGSVHGAGTATLTFECTVREGLDFSDQNAVDLENVASATGTRPDPDRPDDPGAKLPENPDPSDPAAPPGGSAVAPADPSLRMEKTVENVSAPGAKVTHLGDVLRYTVALENAGAADSCLMGAVISDPLPAGMEPVAGTLWLAVDGGEPVAVPDAAYDAASRTIAVTCGDIWGGQKAVLTFDVAVGEAALGADNANIAEGHGTVPSKGPDSVPRDPEPGEPAEPPAGEPAASTPPVAPPVIVGDDPEEGDVSIGKTAENTSRGDGTTHVGDTVRYEITLRNEEAGTSWMDAVIRDDVPEGLEPVSGTIRLRLPDGTEAAVDDAAYDPGTRVLAVAVGHLHGEQEAVLAFDALVTGAAVGADIGNVAVGYGTPPSAWDPDAERPEPGAPFDPPGGWDSWEEGRGKVVSDPAYPPGVDRLGGVVAGDLPGDKRRTTIAHKLAQTGDALAAAAGAALAGALAAAALALATRRRRRAR